MQCDKSFDVGEYLDYANFKWRKRLIDKVVDECNENIDGNDYGKVYKSCTLYIVLLIITFIIIMGFIDECF